MYYIERNYTPTRNSCREYSFTRDDTIYDPSGSRPDEIILTVTFTIGNIGNIVFYSRSRTNWTVGFGTLSYILIVDNYSAFPARFEMKFREDDGGFLGHDDYIGYGMESKENIFNDDTSTSERLHTTIDGNTVWVDLSASRSSGIQMSNDRCPMANNQKESP